MANEGEGQGSGQGQQGQGEGGKQAPAWHEGKATPEILGYWQNKGYDITDPVKVAVESGKAAFELQKHFGVPAEQLLRLPKDASDQAGWDGIYSRLGVPGKAEEYDLSALKYADGAALEDSFASALRAALHSGRVPKDRAGEVAKPILKFLQDADAAEVAERSAKVQAEQTKLKADWGTNGQNYEVNRLTALQGARRLGITPEEFAAMETTPGGARMMEMFRRVGAGTSEDTFREGGTGTNPTTVNGAKARLAELQADPEWAKRLIAGGAAEKREFYSLTELIAAEAA